MTPAFSATLTTLAKTFSSGSSCTPKMRTFSLSPYYSMLSTSDLRPVIHQSRSSHLQVLNSAKAAKERPCEEFGNERRQPNVCPDDAAIPVHSWSMHSTRWLLPSSFFAGWSGQYPTSSPRGRAGTRLPSLKNGA